MHDWLNELPFAWLLIAALAFFYIAATAIYTRGMILVADWRDRASKGKGQQTTIERQLDVSVADPAPVLETASISTERSVAVRWDRLTRGDVEHIKCELALRRSEMLARHEEELRELDVRFAELEILELAIDAFAQKYPPAK